MSITAIGLHPIPFNKLVKRMINHRHPELYDKIAHAPRKTGDSKESHQKKIREQFAKIAKQMTVGQVISEWNERHSHRPGTFNAAGCHLSSEMKAFAIRVMELGMTRLKWSYLPGPVSERVHRPKSKFGWSRANILLLGTLSNSLLEYISRKLDCPIHEIYVCDLLEFEPWPTLSSYRKTAEKLISLGFTPGTSKFIPKEYVTERIREAHLIQHLVDEHSLSPGEAAQVLQIAKAERWRIKYKP